jgi:hypothetical protein
VTIDLAAGGYATEQDYADWITPDGEPADGVLHLLRSATFVIAWACNRNPYQDTPSDTDADPLRDATCAQVQSWLALGVTPANAGIVAASIVKKSSILAADVEFDTGGQLTALQNAAKGIAEEARIILLAANLLWQAVALGADPCDPLPQWGQGRQWGPFAESLSGEYEWPVGPSWL